MGIFMSLWLVKFRQISWQQRVLLVTVASACLPFPITCAMLIVSVAVLLCDKTTRGIAFFNKSDMLIFGVGALAVIVPLFYRRYISAIAGIAICIGIMLFVLLRAWMSQGLYRLIMKACCVSSVFCFVFAIVQKIVFGPMFRSTGGLLNANYYGTICEFIIIFAVYLLISSKRNKGIYCSVLVINIAGIFLCDCQSAWIAIMVGVFCMLILSGRKRLAAYFAGAAMVALLVGIFTPGLLPRLEHMPQSFITRQNIWSTAIKGIIAHPLFGQGALTYLFSHELYGGYKTYHAHSLYLDPILSYGVLGTSLLLSYIVITIRQMAVRHRRPVICVAVAAITAAMVHGVTDNTLLWVQTGLLMIFVFSGAGIKSPSEIKGD